MGDDNQPDLSVERLPEVESYPPSLEPEEVLSFLVGTLRSPINSIEGWARLLSEDEFEDKQKAIELIPLITQYVTKNLKEAIIYLEQRREQK